MIKPFDSIEEWEQYEKDCSKMPQLDNFANAAYRKAVAKKGMNNRAEKFDSFFEYTFCTYMRVVKGYIVERNQKLRFLTYINDKGKIAKFYPDFLVNGSFYEIKGQFRDNDRLKKDQCTDVTWMFAEDIGRMKAELDSQYPQWREDFIQTN